MHIMAKYTVIKTYGSDRNAFGPFNDLSAAKDFIHSDIDRTIKYFTEGMGDIVANFDEYHSGSGSATLYFDITTIGPQHIDWEVFKLTRPEV